VAYGLIAHLIHVAAATNVEPHPTEVCTEYANLLVYTTGAMARKSMTFTEIKTTALFLCRMPQRMVARDVKSTQENKPTVSDSPRVFMRLASHRQLERVTLESLHSTLRSILPNEVVSSPTTLLRSSRVILRGNSK